MLEQLFSSAREFLSQSFLSSLQGSGSRANVIAHVLTLVREMLDKADVGEMLAKPLLQSIEQDLQALPPGCDLGHSVRLMLARKLLDLLKTREQKKQTDTATADSSSSSALASIFPTLKQYFRQAVIGSASCPSSRHSQQRGARSARPSRGDTRWARPCVLMLVGLQGSGKTTTLCKLAYYFGIVHRCTVGIVAADTVRAGALAQIRQNVETMCRCVKGGGGQSIVVYPFCAQDETSDPVQCTADGLTCFETHIQVDLVLVDTAGCDLASLQHSNLDYDLVAVERACRPNKIAMTLDATHGRLAAMHALAFVRVLGRVDFGVLTKADARPSSGDGTMGRGGGALTAVTACNIPILFVGTGEHMHNLSLFSPDIMVAELFRIPLQTLLVAGADGGRHSRRRPQQQAAASRAAEETQTYRLLQNFNDPTRGKQVMEESASLVSQDLTFGLMKRFLESMRLTPGVAPAFGNDGRSVKLTQTQVLAVLQSMATHELALPVQDAYKACMRRYKCPKKNKFVYRWQAILYGAGLPIDERIFLTLKTSANKLQELIRSRVKAATTQRR